MAAPRPRVAAVIPAAGQGLRLNDTADETPPLPKALRLLGDRPLLRWAADGLAAAVDDLVVAAPESLLTEVRTALAGLTVPYRVVAGGRTRQQSVQYAVAAVDPETTHVLVHDAARPLVPTDVVDRVVDALVGGADAVVPAVAVPDSLRMVTATGTSQVVDRTTVRAVQTPQGFRIDVLREAHAAATAADATDDASLVERLGVRVALVDGSEMAFKITKPMDLRLADALVRTRVRRP